MFKETVAIGQKIFPFLFFNIVKFIEHHQSDLEKKTNSEFREI